MYRKILSENPALTKLPIVVADDSEVSRKICEKFLTEAGFKNLHFAKDGHETLEMVEQYSPNILVCDIYMPGYTGFELINIIRNNPKTKDLAILVHTASHNNTDINDAFKKGATDVVLKPVQREEFLTRCVIHLENTTYRKRVSEELEKARILQGSIIPSAKKLEIIKENSGIETGFVFQPSSELGGDFWSVKQIKENLVAIYCVDLTGHGIASAMNTFRVHSLIEENLNANIHIPEFLGKINSVLCEIMPIGQYATLFFGLIDTEKSKIYFTNAGAPYPMLCNKEAQVKNLVMNSVPIGMVKDSVYEVKEENFEKGDVLLVYSDALNESANQHGEFFTDEKISKTLAKVHKNNAQDIVDSIYSRFTSFTGRTNFDDDLTINIYKRR